MIFEPAWSWQFSPESLQKVHPIPLLDELTSDWAWGGSTGKGVKVAVIDSGVDSAHPAVGGRLSGYLAIQEAGGELLYDASPHQDESGHGTACAGIIRRFAPDCDLYSVKILGRTLTGRGPVLAAAFQWAIENGMQVCNMSLGTTKREFSPLLHELADRAYFRNVMVVSAANNMPIPSFPSTYASVISVAAHAEPQPLRVYYNPQPPVEFGAPGINVQVAWLNGGHITATGNSFAAPHISGLVAAILAKHPALTIFQMKAVLRALSANVKDASASSRLAVDSPGGGG
jgi:subtilisin